MTKEVLKNLPSGHDGEGYIIVNEKILAAFKIAKISARIEAIKDSKRFLNERMTQNAVRGANGMGDISYYHRTMALVRAVKDYIDTGIYPDITIQYHVLSAAYGRSEVTLTGVILDTIGFGMLDDSSDTAQVIDTAYTFDGYDIVESFKE